MESLSRFVSQYVPWFWGFLSWLLAILTGLALLSIPAYFIVYPIVAKVRREIGSYLTRLFARHAAAADRRRRSIEEMVEDFRHNSGLAQLSERSAALHGVVLSLSRTLKGIKPPLDRFGELPAKFTQVGDRVNGAASKTPPSLPTMPATEELAAQDAGLRTAWVRLFVSSIVLIVLVCVNTGMLGQILRDLGFIPHDLAYFGIHLYMLLALMLTIVEGGIGFVHTATRPAADEAHKVPLWPAAAFCFAVVIACMEGFFYSQVAPSSNMLFSLPGGYQVREGSFFFLWGFTLVMVLFSLGMVWGTSVEKISSSANHFPRLVRKLALHGERFSKASEAAAISARHIREEIDAAGKRLQSAVQDANSLLASAERIQGLTALTAVEPGGPRELTSAEAHHFVRMAGLWLVLTLIAAGIFVAAGTVVCAYSFLNVTSAAAVLVAVGLAAYFVVLGLVVPRGEMILEGTVPRRVIVSGSVWRARIAMAMGIAALVVFAVLAWRLGIARYPVALWAAVLVLGVSLAAAASQSAATGRGLRPFFRLCANLMLSFLEAAGRLCGRIVFVIVYGVEVLALALAAPIFILRGRELPSLQVAVEARPEASPVGAPS